MTATQEASRVARWTKVSLIVIAVIVMSVLFSPVLFRSLLFQPFNTPSNSMAPTLQLGDYFFVSKYAYGYTHYSLPFSPPLFSGRIFGSAPLRGDVVVFRLPKDDLTDYVKRVVGLPGDRIQMKEGLLYINDTPVKRERLADFVGGDVCGSGPAARVRRWRETLRTASVMRRSIASTTAFTTTPASTRCLQAISL